MGELAEAMSSISDATILELARSRFRHAFQLIADSGIQVERSSIALLSAFRRQQDVFGAAAEGGRGYVCYLS